MLFRLHVFNKLPGSLEVTLTHGTEGTTSLLTLLHTTVAVTPRTTSLPRHPCAYNLVLAGLSMGDDIAAKTGPTGVTPALSVRPTPPEHKQGNE